MGPWVGTAHHRLSIFPRYQQSPLLFLSRFRGLLSSRLSEPTLPFSIQDNTALASPWAPWWSHLEPRFCTKSCLSLIAWGSLTVIPAHSPKEGSVLSGQELASPTPLPKPTTQLQEVRSAGTLPVMAHPGQGEGTTACSSPSPAQG